MRNILIILMLVFVSCSPLKRIEWIYNHHPDLRPVSTIDTVTVTNDTTIYDDTTIYVTLPPDTVINEIPVYDTASSDPCALTLDSLIMESDRAISKSWIEDDKLIGILIDKQLNFEFKLDSALRMAYHWEKMYINETKVVKEPYCSKWKNIMSIVGIVLSLVLILAGIYLIKKK